ncbi:MAG: hypothetical protein ABI068_07640 [Ktedonobacterales bacterium]
MINVVRVTQPSVVEVQSQGAQGGALITGFASDASGKSPAKQAGLQTGDIIVG